MPGPSPTAVSFAHRVLCASLLLSPCFLEAPEFPTCATHTFTYRAHNSLPFFFPLLFQKFQIILGKSLSLEAPLRGTPQAHLTSELPISLNSCLQAEDQPDRESHIFQVSLDIMKTSPSASKTLKSVPTSSSQNYYKYLLSLPQLFLTQFSSSTSFQNKGKYNSLTIFPIVFLFFCK